MPDRSSERPAAPRYTLRETPRAFMIDKEVDDVDFPGKPFYVRRQSFGPFRTRDQATAFMTRHGGRP